MRILRARSHVNGDQESLVKDRAPEMGLEKLFQSGIGRALFRERD